MYESKLGFTTRPFTTTPRPDWYFPMEEIETARTTLIRTIERAEGTGLLIAQAGTGKTLLSQLLANYFQPVFRVVQVSGTQQCTERAFLQNVLFELDLPYSGMDEGELRLSLVDHLRPGHVCPNGMLLLVDDAHALPGHLLEEIHTINNIVHDSRPSAQLVLFGSPSLEENLANRRLESFSQRITARCYLNGLSFDETGAFIRAQLAAAGKQQQDLFDESAIDAIHQLTDGVPRLINQLCDHAIIRAVVNEQNLIRADDVHTAWGDLQQLPTGWSDDSHYDDSHYDGGDDAEDMVIEFGELPDVQESIDPEYDSATNVHLEHDATERIDDISEQIEMAVSISVERATDDNTVDVASQDTPLDLSLNESQRDPFGASFGDEEIVLDRYASLDAMYWQKRPQVASVEGHEISVVMALLQETHQGQITPATTANQDAGDGEPSTINVLPESTQLDSSPERIFSGAQVEITIDPAAAADLQDTNASPRQAEVAVGSTPEFQDAQVALDSTSQQEHTDDRDMIIIEDENGEPVRREVAVPKKPKPQNYRQLFTRLRQGG